MCIRAEEWKLMVNGEEREVAGRLEAVLRESPAMSKDYFEWWGLLQGLKKLKQRVEISKSVISS